jgi:hypothetical protein
MNKIHIGDEIKNVLNSSDLSVTEFAKKINQEGIFIQYSQGMQLRQICY